MFCFWIASISSMNCSSLKSNRLVIFSLSLSLWGQFERKKRCLAQSPQRCYAHGRPGRQSARCFCFGFLNFLSISGILRAVVVGGCWRLLVVGCWLLLSFCLQEAEDRKYYEPLESTYV